MKKIFIFIGISFFLSQIAAPSAFARSRVRQFADNTDQSTVTPTPEVSPTDIPMSPTPTGVLTMPIPSQAITPTPSSSPTSTAATITPTVTAVPNPTGSATTSTVPISTVTPQPTLTPTLIPRPQILETQTKIATVAAVIQNAPIIKKIIGFPATFFSRALPKEFYAQDKLTLGTTISLSLAALLFFILGVALLLPNSIKKLQAMLILSGQTYTFKKGQEFAQA